MGFEFSCHVFADPPVHNFGVWWNDEHEPVLIKEGANDADDTDSNNPKGQFTFDVQEGENEYESLMTLKIQRVYTQHFREYYFEARNKLGKSKHTLRLKNKESMRESNAAVHVITYICLLSITSLVLIIIS